MIDRPNSLDDIIGNDTLKQCLKITLSVAKLQNKSLPHILFQGYYGCGKTTIALVLAKEMGCKCIHINAASIKENKDILDILPNIKYKDILFIDEIHRLKKSHGELLYPVMEDFELRLVWSDDILKFKTSGKLLTIKLPEFTIIGATTDIGSIAGPLFSRFKLNYFIDTYSVDDLKKLILINSNKLNIFLEEDAVLEIAKRSKGIPRLANSRLEWIKDYSIFYKKNIITMEDVVHAFELQDIDEFGFDRNDRKYLAIVQEMQPVGLQQIAARLGMTPETIIKYIEPYMLSRGLVQITKSGRQIPVEVLSIDTL